MDIHSRLWRLKLNEARLKHENYPRPHPSIQGKAQLHNMAYSVYKVIPSSHQRHCKRCAKIYAIDDEGLAAVVEECSYHPFRLGGGRAPRHRCCGRGPHGLPCKVASQHISQDVDLEKLVDFVSTRGNPGGSSSVFALDCEMVCTKAGLELAAISVVDTACNVVYETVVLPRHPIIDYLTDYSDLTAADFRGITTRLTDVHTSILGLFGQDTLLVGHGLEHDFLAMKLLHDNVVDTAVLYPHTKGNGFRNSLAYLQERHLPHVSRTISGQLKCRGDAALAMKLALLKC
ncbi:putative exonuclease GOR [Macrobrachium nipponense]|uniref:putative exonuclease GOR n=1 Tax=Macrobrachium nipponense TaxID=159736 RepID=UPI0030C89123